MKVEKIELPKTLTEDDALAFIGRIAGVCTGIDEKLKDDRERAIRVGKMNLTESCGMPTRAWEFLPLVSINSKYGNFREGLEKNNTLKSLCEVYNKHKDYYEDTVTLLSLLVMTGNYWDPTAVP